MHLPGLLGLGLAYGIRLVAEYGLSRGRPGGWLVWPARVGLLLGLVGDGILIWVVLDAFYL
jgi:hypothetical protein